MKQYCWLAGLLRWLSRPLFHSFSVSVPHSKGSKESPTSSSRTPFVPLLGSFIPETCRGSELLVRQLLENLPTYQPTNPDQDWDSLVVKECESESFSVAPMKAFLLSRQHWPSPLSGRPQTIMHDHHKHCSHRHQNGEPPLAFQIPLTREKPLIEALRPLWFKNHHGL